MVERAVTAMRATCTILHAPRTAVMRNINAKYGKFIMPYMASVLAR